MKKLILEQDLFLCFPKEIINDERLSPCDKLLISYIIALDNDKGCYASNDHLAYFVGCSACTISKSIYHLTELGYITSNSEGTGRTYTRRVRDVLKSHKRFKSKLKSSLSKSSILPTKKTILIDIIEKELITEKIIKKEEPEIIVELKKEYEAINLIKWDERNEKELAELYKNINDTFKNRLEDVNDEEKENFFKRIFKIIITNRPKFFNDSLPWTFNKYWNKVIQDNNIKGKISKLLSRYAERDSGKFKNTLPPPPNP